ncbi:hypothetical protein DPMN_046488 [Dreissena polymorpha]|uniref:C2H2-type domain-containing protein n=1 Tax=Dreissena polymorpha TaxID=45954 RepID=A0A9D4D692_DREPO|nr:hypothetical protein DPMN_046488 [Dreissena polymorpha]
MLENLTTKLNTLLIVNYLCRPHQQFLEDVTDSYIVAACLDVMEEGCSNKNNIEFVEKISQKVMDCFNLGVTENSSISRIRNDLEAIHADEQKLFAMRVNDHYQCALCGKCFTSLVWFKKHLTNKHHWKLHQANTNEHCNNAVGQFLFMSLLFRDTCDSYKMCDGARSVCNAHFEWLYDSALKHSKYKIWLWRMITYTLSILGFRESFEYKWNISVNLNGGIRNNIPNDNAVEIQVNNIKRELNTQGANKSYESAKQICMTTQVIHAIKQNLMRTSRTAKSKSTRPEADKSGDIMKMVEFLRQKGAIKNVCWNSFQNFREPLSGINAEELHAWIGEQKRIANMFM